MTARPDRLICGCGHHYCYHSPRGKCQKRNRLGTPCQCQQYIGPAVPAENIENARDTR